MAVRLYDWNTKTVADETYVGATIQVGTQSTRIMSDVWGTEEFAIVWDAAAGRPKHLSLNVYEWSNDRGSSTAEVDATPEVLEAYRMYRLNLKVEQAMGTAREDAEKVVKGRTVRVVSGRQGKGTVGPVVVEIVRPYNMGWKSVARTKVAIATSDVMIDVPGKYGKVYKNYRDLVWAWAQNCEVVDPVYPTREEIVDMVLANYKDLQPKV